MIKELTKIQLSEQDIKQLVAEKYNLDLETCTCSINHYPAGYDRPYDPAVTTFTVEGMKTTSSYPISIYSR